MGTKTISVFRLRFKWNSTWEGSRSQLKSSQKPLCESQSTCTNQGTHSTLIIFIILRPTLRNSRICSEEGVEGGTIRSQRTRGSNSIRHSCVQRIPLATPAHKWGYSSRHRVPLWKDGQSLGTDLATRQR